MKEIFQCGKLKLLFLLYLLDIKKDQFMPDIYYVYYCTTLHVLHLTPVAENKPGRCQCHLALFFTHSFLIIFTLVLIWCLYLIFHFLMNKKKTIFASLLTFQHHAIYNESRKYLNEKKRKKKFNKYLLGDLFIITFFLFE